jgi:hypothetical protein
MHSSEQGYLFGGWFPKNRAVTHLTCGANCEIPNPWDNTKRIIVFAGNKAVGTKACVLALTNFWQKTLQKCKTSGDFAAVIQGFDLDGDGKVTP